MIPVFRSLSEMILIRGESHAEKICFTFLADGEDETRSLTYGDLARRAREIAGGLLGAGLAKGDRAILLYGPGLEFIEGLFGCLCAGVIAVPAYPPVMKRMGETIPKLRRIAQNSGAKAILTTSEISQYSEQMREIAPDLATLPWLSSETMIQEGAKLPSIAEEDVAFLQYTSGSTGNPKGVVLRHRNLLANERAIAQAFCHDENLVSVSWLPTYHDMGLIGNVIQPVFMGGLSVQMSPLNFLQKPQRWWRAVSKYRATTTGGPNFSYDLSVDKVPEEARAGLDLASVRVLYNGAEPIRMETLERFFDVYSGLGLSRKTALPCYGLAEASLIVSGRLRDGVHTRSVDALDLAEGVVQAPKTDERSRVLVSSGPAILDHEILIVDRDLKPMGACGVGEILVRGRSIGEGYWGDPDLSEQTFRVCGDFLRTGDLGFLDEAGELYVTGRAKDVIIIRGKNYYPQDIELATERCHDRLRKGGGVAFAVERDGHEHVVVVQEYDRRSGYDRREGKPVPAGVDRRQGERRSKPPEQEAFAPPAGAPPVHDYVSLASEVLARVSQETDVSLSTIVFCKVGQMLRTSSGKVMRQAMKQAFLEGKIDILHQWDASRRSAVVVERREFRSKEDLRGWINEWFSASLGGVAIDAEKPFSSFNIDSAKAIAFCRDLGTATGKKISPTIMYDYPTMNELVDHLAEKFSLV